MVIAVTAIFTRLLCRLLSFALGGLFALYEGYEKLHDPHGITEWQWVPVAVRTVGSILLEGNSFRVAVKNSRVS